MPRGSAAGESPRSFASLPSLSQASSRRLLLLRQIPLAETAVSVKCGKYCGCHNTASYFSGLCKLEKTFNVLTHKNPPFCIFLLKITKIAKTLASFMGERGII